MTPDQIKRAGRLIENREELRRQLDELNKGAGYPLASLRYFNNSHREVIVSVPVTLQETVESLLRAILEGQVTKIEGDLRNLGAIVDD